MFYNSIALPLTIPALTEDPEAGAVVIVPPEAGTAGVCCGADGAGMPPCASTVTAQAAFFPLNVTNVIVAVPSRCATMTPLEDIDTISASELIQVPFLLAESTFFGVTVAFNVFF